MITSNGGGGKEVYACGLLDTSRSMQNGTAPRRGSQIARNSTLENGITGMPSVAILDQLRHKIVSEIREEITSCHHKLVQEVNALRKESEMHTHTLEELQEIFARNQVNAHLGVPTIQEKCLDVTSSQVVFELPPEPPQEHADERRGRSKESSGMSPRAKKDKTRAARFTHYGNKEDPKTGEVEEHVLTVLEKGATKDAMGEPVGQFKGRPNLFAFLQAKDWDSITAVLPDDIDDSNVVLYKRCPWLSERVMSTKFDLFIGVMIIANSLTMGLELEYKGTLTADSIGITPDEGNWPGADPGFEVLEHIFTIIFLIEFILRFFVMGLAYFKVLFNLLDVTVVVTSCLELYVFGLIGGGSDVDLSQLRLLRTLRILRILRLIRVMRLFQQLRMLVTAVASSMTSLGWSIILLGLIQLIGSIFITLSLQASLQDENIDIEVRANIYTYFGNFSRSCISLVEITFAAGTWDRCGRLVIFKVSRLYAIFFIGYLIFVSFAMIRVISAIFLKDTLAAAAKENEEMTSAVNKSPEYVRAVKKVFHMLDVADEGFINLTELHVGLKRDDIRKQLAECGIGGKEVEGLFILMDDGDNEITFAEFLTGCLRLKVANKGVDLPTLLYENKKLLSQVLSIESQVDKLSEKMGVALEDNFGDTAGKKIPSKIA